MTKPETTIPSSSQSSSPSLDAKGLEEAFAIFYAESQKLETQQIALQGKIDQLSDELQKSNQRLGILMNAIPAGVILLENNIVLLHNPAVLHFLPGLSAGQSFEIPRDWQASIAPGEYLISTQDSANSKPQKTVQVIRIDEGSRSFIQIQDITANIALHQETQRENRLTAMGKMAAGIAHQFRTPLATALLYSSHLCDDSLTPDMSKEFANRLRKQLLDLEKLSQDMLRFISNRPTKTILVKAQQIIDEAQASIQALFESNDVELIVQSNIPASNMLLVEPKSIPNALVAILENALSVSKPKDKVTLQARVDTKKLMITIEDQGPGIASTIIDSLFEPFSTTSANGTGLGLSIAKNTIEAHRGSISVENSSHGAIFKITLPITAE
ncbi:PAS domain-containing sensor histidine kinase [Polynucleobacter sp. MWH-UH2A]|uniref:sensor histidine kinase n=1 Tax=Polynucleobacter sp. MWH-UH2A TaxID=1855617 RepID=UPI001BFDDEAC|nr:HAMP domain-containing sensor histidine kinase [Polynucleobacter sp. MWH-UH2A]QWD64629.1 HAMP domain-containing histidine kinase [Polynucleobacter sp. MWH-UH2A]